MDNQPKVRSALIAVLDQTVRPLFATRDVPDTHDLDRLALTIHLLVPASASGALSNFGQAAAGRTEMVHWRQVSAPVKSIWLQNGSCGAPTASENELCAPGTHSETEKARARCWRSEMNRQPNDRSTTRHAALNALLVCAASDFDAGCKWRRQQQEHQVVRIGSHCPETTHPTITRNGVANFMLHYQRLTLHARKMPADQANVVCELDRGRSLKRPRPARIAA